MMRPIDADALLYCLEKAKEHFLDEGDCYNALIVKTMLNVLKTEGAMPTIDVEPVRHGRWKLFGISPKTLHVYEMVQCTECGTMFNRFTGTWYKFCPKCGARMDLKEESV